MTKFDKERKNKVVNAMYNTAVANGKSTSLWEMESLANRLHRLETTLTRLAEDECNYPVYDSAKQERLENLAQTLIETEIGCKCYTQRDPRGFIIRMYLKDFCNSWDSETTGLAW